MLINAAIFAVALGLPGAVCAQGQTPTTPAANPPAATAAQSPRKDIHQDRQQIHTDRKGLKALDAQHAAVIKDLDAKAKTAVEAVKANVSLTAAQQKAQIADIRKDHALQRKEADLKYHEDRKRLLTDIHQERRDIRQDERQLQQDKNAIH